MDQGEANGDRDRGTMDLYIDGFSASPGLGRIARAIDFEGFGYLLGPLLLPDFPPTD